MNMFVSCHSKLVWDYFFLFVVSLLSSYWIEPAGFPLAPEAKLYCSARKTLVGLLLVYLCSEFCHLPDDPNSLLRFRVFC